jgi:putative redox protein
MAFYAHRYLVRHNLPTDGLPADVTSAMGAKPARVEAIDVRLIVIQGVPVERLDPRPAVATSCRFSIRLPRNPRYRSPWRKIFGPVRWMVRR